ncbi:MAG: DNA methyltransferase [Acidobacteria bacterium]|nr:MAG: DNA methyltransferase [Acidobacteriota bacterium]REK02876.1 MAG: DNA methyltransferase [Acidobacteriota bacterium]REK13320.1 MAG: DNA methyltransferase [Acidobacteriota bacterium]REK41314.1 MAG: DNA methyltransferase [Acidobacteriota bacterium]
MVTSVLRSVPDTYGVKYAGSKLRLLPHILDLVGKTKAETVLDAFSGTTRVAQALAANGIRVTANDISELSRVFAICFLRAPGNDAEYRDLIDHLNSLPGKDGWFTKHYGGDPAGYESVGRDGLKKPFQIHNTKKLDAIREEIKRLSLQEEEKCVALTSLILALDKVDSTIGHFASYLRKWSRRSYNELFLELPGATPIGAGHKVFQKDVFEALGEGEWDLAYLDPPYGSNNEKMPPSRVRYAAYYHFWKTVILDDRPELFGKALRRSDSSDELSYSPFEDFRRGEDKEYIAIGAIRRLIREVPARYVLLSYSSGGRATRKALESALLESGRIMESLSIDHQKNVMASMSWTGDWASEQQAPNQEYLFLLEK